MKTMPSSEFRKTFARLEEVVHVTVNGHVIGTWTPIALAQRLEMPTQTPSTESLILGVDGIMVANPYRRVAFRPAPKPGKGK
jgi:hypothetical protein